MQEIKTGCACGAVQGTIQEYDKRQGSRLVCYCKDCQAFAHFLEKGDEVLDEHGGTEVYQIAPCQFSIHQGIENLACVRLSPKGLFRWYTSCCHTPVGNTISGKMPFVGVVHNFIHKDADADKTIGPVIMSIQAKDAKGRPGGDSVHQGVPVTLLAKTVYNLAMRALAGKAKPNALFTDNGEPIKPPQVLTKAQRADYSSR